MWDDLSDPRRGNGVTPAALISASNLRTQDSSMRAKPMSSSRFVRNSPLSARSSSYHTILLMVLFPTMSGRCDNANILEVIEFPPSEGNAIRLKRIPNICNDSLGFGLKDVNAFKYVDDASKKVDRSTKTKSTGSPSSSTFIPSLWSGRNGAFPAAKVWIIFSVHIEFLLYHVRHNLRAT